MAEGGNLILMAEDMGDYKSKFRNETLGLKSGEGNGSGSERFSTLTGVNESWERDSTITRLLDNFDGLFYNADRDGDPFLIDDKPNIFAVLRPATEEDMLAAYGADRLAAGIADNSLRFANSSGERQAVGVFVDGEGGRGNVLLMDHTYSEERRAWSTEFHIPFFRAMMLLVTKDN